MHGFALFYCYSLFHRYWLFLTACQCQRFIVYIDMTLTTIPTFHETGLLLFLFSLQSNYDVKQCFNDNALVYWCIKTIRKIIERSDIYRLKFDILTFDLWYKNILNAKSMLLVRNLLIDSPVLGYRLVYTCKYSLCGGLSHVSTGHFRIVALRKSSRSNWNTSCCKRL